MRNRMADEQRQDRWYLDEDGRPGFGGPREFGRGEDDVSGRETYGSYVASGRGGASAGLPRREPWQRHDEDPPTYGSYGYGPREHEISKGQGFAPGQWAGYRDRGQRQELPWEWDRPDDQGWDEAQRGRDYGRLGRRGDETLGRYGDARSWEGNFAEPGFHPAYRSGHDDEPARRSVRPRWPDQDEGRGWSGRSEGRWDYGRDASRDWYAEGSSWGDRRGMVSSGYGTDFGARYDRGTPVGDAWGYGRPDMGRYDQDVSYRGRGPRGYHRSDERIREELSERLEDSDFVDASDVEVAVRDGVVTLSGSVQDRRSKRIAEDLADGCRGVTDVRNELTVAGGARDRSAGAGSSGGAGTSGAPTGGTGATGGIGGTTTGGMAGAAGGTTDMGAGSRGTTATSSGGAAGTRPTTGSGTPIDRQTNAGQR